MISSLMVNHELGGSHHHLIPEKMRTSTITEFLSKLWYTSALMNWAGRWDDLSRSINFDWKKKSMMGRLRSLLHILHIFNFFSPTNFKFVKIRHYFCRFRFNLKMCANLKIGSLYKCVCTVQVHVCVWLLEFRLTSPNRHVILCFNFDFRFQIQPFVRDAVPFWITLFRTFSSNCLSKVCFYTDFKVGIRLLLSFFVCFFDDIAFPAKKMRRNVNPESDMFLKVIEMHPEILQGILSTIINIVMFEDCKNQWSLSRPLLGLILLYEDYFR